MYLHTIILLATFCESCFCTNLKKFTRTKYMSDAVWNDKKFDAFIKSSLITCVSFCAINSPPWIWSGKFCNAVFYNEATKICELAELTKLVDTSGAPEKEIHVDGAEIPLYKEINPFWPGCILIGKNYQGAETDIPGSPWPGLHTKEDCANGCASHPDCKAFVLGYWMNPPGCWYKSTDDSSILADAGADSGPISTCWYLKWVFTKPT